MPVSSTESAAAAWKAVDNRRLHQLPIPPLSVKRHAFGEFSAHSHEGAVEWLSEVDDANSARKDRAMIDEMTVPASFKIYEDGKHRRYQLLFTVNGGAFAIAKLLVDRDPPYVLGGLTLTQLAIGMFLFTLVMCLDIFLFGRKMRKTYLSDAFAWQGKLVLILIAAIICVGWSLVARH
jgi:hypothetical protein